MSVTDDRELERYLRRQDPLSRAYMELEAGSPSHALDQAVMQRAREALHSQRPTRHARLHGWAALGAIAATVLLSFALIMKVVLEPEMQRDRGTIAPAPAAQPEDGGTAPHAAEDHGIASSARALTPAEPPTPISAPTSIERRRSTIEAEIRATAAQAPAIAESASVPSPADEARQDDWRAAAQLKREGRIKAPQEWLAEIERLRAAGDAEAADREQELFRQAYPDYPEKQASPEDR
jgi:hypothetical protein